MKDSAKILEELKSAFGDVVEELKTEDTLMPYALVRAEKIVDVLKWFKEKGFNHLSAISSVDDPPENIWVVYHLIAVGEKVKLAVKVKLPRENPEVPSVGSVFPTALWHEREAYDLMGVKFKDHPDLRRILMPEDWVGHPLRKDYVQPEEYHGISTR